MLTLGLPVRLQRKALESLGAVQLGRGRIQIADRGILERWSGRSP